MNRLKRKAGHFIGIPIALLTAVCIAFGPKIYRFITPQVSGIGIGPGYIHGMKYDVVVSTAAIHSDSDGDYLFLIKSRNTYWYIVQYLAKTRIKILCASEADGKSAIETVSGDLLPSDFLLEDYDVDPADGQSVWMLK